LATRYGNANFASTVVRATIGDLTALLAGDVPPWRWRRLRECASGRLAADVLVLPHHGAEHIDDEVTLRDLLDLVTPSVIAISVGSANQYRHPHIETLNTAGAWARENNARLVCTQLNAACAANAKINGGLEPHFACAGNVVIERDGMAGRVVTARGAHSAFVDSLQAPRCAPFPAVAW